MSEMIFVQFRLSTRPIITWVCFSILFFATILSLNVFPVQAQTSSELNFQGRIVRNAPGQEGLNVIDGNPTCINAGADICKFEVAYFDLATAGTELYVEEFTAVELGANDGIYNLALGTGSYISGTYLVFTEMFKIEDDLYIEVRFAPDGVMYDETFTKPGGNRMELRAVPYAIRSEYSDGASQQFQFDVNNSSVGAGYSGVAEGQIYFDSSTDLLRFYNGTSWQALATPGIGFVQGGNSFGTLAQLGTNDLFGLAFLTDGAEKMRLTTDGKLGIATTTIDKSLTVNGDAVFGNRLGGDFSGYRFFQVHNLTNDISQNSINMHSRLIIDATADSAVTYSSFYSNLITDSSSSANYTNWLYATQSQFNHYGSGTVNMAEGFNGIIANSWIGTITTARGGRVVVANQNTGTIVNSVGLYVQNGSNNGTINNAVGILLDDITHGTNKSNLSIGTSTIPTGDFSIYNVSLKDNYFEGRLGLGETAPSQSLDILGSVELESTTTSTSGVIYKGSDRFLHNFQHPTGNLAVPDGFNLFLGINAGNFSMGSTADFSDLSSYNTGVGYESLMSNTTGSFNSALGYETLTSNTTGLRNSAFGYMNLNANTSGYENSGFGFEALKNNSNGFENSAFGAYSLITNSSGYENSAFGMMTLLTNSSGYGNTALGAFALGSNTTGYRNTSIGNGSGRFASNLDPLQTANNSVFIGSFASSLSDTSVNEIVIGANAFGLGSNTVTLGNDSILTTALKGDVGIGITGPSYKLDVSDGTGIVGRFSGRVIGGNAVNSDEFVTKSQLDTVAADGVLSVTGTTNQITASPTTGNVVLTLPTDLRAPGTLNAVTGIYTGAVAGTLRIDASGNLSNIGTISSTYLSSGANFVDLVGASTEFRMNGTATITSGRLGRFGGGTAAAPAFSFSSDPDNGMYRATTNEIAFSTAGVEQLRIDANGYMGLGIADPEQFFTLDGTSIGSSALQTNISAFAGNGVRINGSASVGQDAITYQAGAAGGGAALAFGHGSDYSTYIDFYVYSGKDTLTGEITHAMRLTEDGNLGIGTSAPLSQLHVTGDGSILSQGSFNSGWNGGSLGSGTRMMWIPEAAAFRAGNVTGTEWNTSNIGNYSTAFGQNTTASGDYTTVFGRNATISHAGSVGIADGNVAASTLTSANTNLFYARFANGYRFYSNATNTVGVTVAAGGGSWASISDVNMKENFENIDPEDTLARIRQIDVMGWNYKSQDPSIRHMGAFAQDFYAQFGLGSSNLAIETIDMDGVTLSAIKGIDNRTLVLKDKAALVEQLIADYGAGEFNQLAQYWGLSSDETTITANYNVVANMITSPVGSFEQATFANNTYAIDSTSFRLNNGKFTLDTDGNIALGGNLTIGGELRGALGNVTVALGDAEGVNAFTVADSAANTIFKIDSSGNIETKSVYESEWILVEAGQSVEVIHSLTTKPSFVNLVRVDDDLGLGESSRGSGVDYYYEIVDESTVRIVNDLSEAKYFKIYLNNLKSSN